MCILKKKCSSPIFFSLARHVLSLKRNKGREEIVESGHGTQVKWSLHVHSVGKTQGSIWRRMKESRNMKREEGRNERKKRNRCPSESFERRMRKSLKKHGMKGRKVEEMG